MDLLYHYYLQHRASPSLRSSSLEAEPTGRSRRLGSEIDLVIGYEEIRDVDLQVVLGYFLPGAAFRANADGFFLKVEIQFRF